ncbi:MAG TPA: DPP IV N-terminal domain-containing protein [Tepidisphaeraceae bacterium]
MTSQTRRRRALTWLLSGTAFVVGVAGAAGCSDSSRPVHGTTYGPSTMPAVASNLQSEHAPDAASAEFDVSHVAPAPPKVNIFGEFDGVERPAPRPVGDAGFQQHTYLDEGYDGDVSVDPKGQYIVFSSTRNSVHSDIYLQKVNGLAVTQLTTDDADDAFPVFSPDGSKIAFCSTRSGNWDIWVMDSDGKNVTQVTSGPTQEIHPSFSPDGSRLVYCALSNRTRQWELWTVDLSGGEKRMIGMGLFPTWSPSKEKDQIAFQKARARGSRWFSLWTLELADGEARRVTEVAVSSNAAIVSPSWSPDGKRLSFATIVEPGKGAAGQQDIWTINTDGTSRHRITDGTGICATPYWGPDNRIYFVSNRGGTETIWSAKADQSSNTATANTDTKEVGGH